MLVRGLWEIYGSVKFEEDKRNKIIQRREDTYMKIDKSKWSGQE
jgi:hypothetical protein